MQKRVLLQFLQVKNVNQPSEKMTIPYMTIGDSGNLEFLNQDPLYKLPEGIRNPSIWELFCETVDLDELFIRVQKLPSSPLQQLRMAEIIMRQGQFGNALRCLPTQVPSELAPLAKAIKTEIYQLQMNPQYNITFSIEQGSGLWIEGNTRLGACRIVELIRLQENFTEYAKTVLEMAQEINLRSVSNKIENLLQEKNFQKSLVNGFYTETLKKNTAEIDKMHFQCLQIMSSQNFISTTKRFEAPWLRAIRDWGNGNSRDIKEGIAPVTSLRTDNRQWILWNLARAWAFMLEGNFEISANDHFQLGSLLDAEHDLKAYWSLGILELLIRSQKTLKFSVQEAVGEALYCVQKLRGAAGRRWATKSYPNALYFLAQQEKSLSWVLNDVVLVDHLVIKIGDQICRNKPGLVRWLNLLTPTETSANNRVMRARLRAFLEQHQKHGVVRLGWLTGFYDVDAKLL